MWAVKGRKFIGFKQAGFYYLDKDEKETDKLEDAKIFDTLDMAEKCIEDNEYNAEEWPIEVELDGKTNKWKETGG